MRGLLIGIVGLLGNNMDFFGGNEESRKVGWRIWFIFERLFTWDVAYMEYIRHSGVVYNNVGGNLSNNETE